MPEQPLPFETASWGRRVIALIVDWMVSTLVVVFFMGWDDYSEPGGNGSLFVLLVFVVESALFTATVGGSFGKMATRLRVVRVADGGRIDPLRALARSVAVALVIPPLVFKRDRRGSHDLVAGSATVTLEVQKAGA